MWIIAALALLIAGGCGRSPLAPSSIDDAPRLASAYLLPTKSPTVRTGAHRITWWVEPGAVTLVKGEDSRHIERLELDGDVWRLVYDDTTGQDTPWRVLVGTQAAPWVRERVEVGQILEERRAMVQTVTRAGVEVEWRPFPYRTEVLSVAEDELTLVFEPLPAAGGRCDRCRETFVYRRGLGMIAWQANWHSPIPLDFSSPTTGPVAPSPLTSFPARP